MHLEDDNGTYGKIVHRTKEDIIEEILQKLCGILIPFKKLGEGWKAVCYSILRNASSVAKEGRFCKFHLIKCIKWQMKWQMRLESGPDP